MIALVPLARYRVQYERASGRPYSTLEQLALRAIAQGATTVDDLHSVFHLHHRLLVEAVVTLTKAGWVAVGGRGGAGFVLTATGQQAVADEEIPALLTITPKTTFVLVELATGMLIPNNDVRYVSRRELGELWQSAVRLPSGVPEDALDEGQVQGFLPRQRGEWIRWIGPIDLVSRGIHWLPVDVDLATSRVAGLPDTLDARLRPHILDACARVRHRLQGEHLTASLPSSRRSVGRTPASVEGPRIPDATIDARIDRDRLLLTDEEHEAYLNQALATTRTSILIASAFLGARRLDSLLGPLEAALSRGVSVDLLWGYATTDDGAISPLARLKKLAYHTQQKDGSGVLRFNASPSGSHAKLVIWDTLDGYEACVGSCNWLSTPFVSERHAERATNLSVRLREAPLVAHLSRCAAVLWQGAQSETLASTGDRWRRLATELERLDASTPRNEEAPSTSNCRVRLLFDREHEGVLRDYASSARSRLLVVSHRLGLVAEPRLVVPSVERAEGYRAKILYGLTELDAESVVRVKERARALRASLKHVAGLHAKVIVSDDRLVISSYNFLSADPFGKAARSRELGVVLEGNALADLVWAHYERESPS